jgi:hypothetical protein
MVVIVSGGCKWAMVMVVLAVLAVEVALAVLAVEVALAVLAVEVALGCQWWW